MIYLSYLLFGVVVGVLSGLFGIGGGTVIVPFVIFILQDKVDAAILTQLALGTSHAVIVLTSIGSIYNHHQKGAVLWDIFKIMVPSLMIGCVAGSLLAGSINGILLKKIIGVWTILIALQMIFKLEPKQQATEIKQKIYQIAGFIIGVFSSLFGIGGGSFMVPFFNYCKITMQKASATSSACSFPIALTSCITFVLQGLKVDGLPPFSLGFVYLPIFLCIIIASIPCTKIGVFLAYKLPNQVLKKAFACLLILVGINFLF